MYTILEGSGIHVSQKQVPLCVIFPQCVRFVWAYNSWRFFFVFVLNLIFRISVILYLSVYLAPWLLMISKSSTFKGMGKCVVYMCLCVSARFHLVQDVYQTELCCDQWGRPWLGPVQELTVTSPLACSSVRVCLYVCVCLVFHFH